MRIAINVVCKLLTVAASVLGIASDFGFNAFGVAYAFEQPPNFVWIIADDMSPDIAAYGAQGVLTPNLD